MINTTFKKIIVASSLVGGLLGGTAAQAGADTAMGLHSWARDAGQSITSKMTYPKMAVQYGKEGQPVFRVTVDREGNVLSSDLTAKSRSGLINSAARRAIKKTDFPDLPDGYKGDKLTFSLKLNYVLAHSTQEYLNLKRQGRVSSERVASTDGPMVASIKIIDNKAD